MRIQIRLFANLRDRFPPETRGRGELEVPDGASVQDVIDELEIPDKQSQMVLVDGQQVKRDRATRSRLSLREGQTVSIFPPVAGG